ncbi:PREDICTED: probable methyltransferase PMT16 [Lupinus angustifolius]|uniref:probable methyltransferase PMT16 n=1 Tax=Lupinus angustifolius TaxID=3871 RepID=UPI00092EE401|nr:PREDICTED: probable methyltransferase PMT16 [Lupinus angustifolius]
MAGGDSTPPYHPTAKTFKPSSFFNLAKKTNLYSLLALLCIISYLFGAYQTTTPTSTTTKTQSTKCPQTTVTSTTHLDFISHHNATTTTTTTSKQYPPCAIKYSEYTPCEDHDRSLRFSRKNMIYRERHCPEKNELFKCRIPAPHGYRNPFPWPESRDLAWYANVPHRELTVEKAVQNWIRFDGDRFRFPGGGTMFPLGADKYIDDIGKLINLRDGSIRTAVDTGCGG